MECLHADLVHDVLGDLDGPEDEQPAADASAWDAIEAPVTEQLHAAVHSDAQHDVNAALAHGLLFRSWTEVAELADAEGSGGDGLALHKRWRLSTGVRCMQVFWQSLLA